ncbi:MAG: FGGY-family carbohydrate kinase [Nocardioidaceae bacterium]|nr:FGGY-family carbohydrate kinase [Nocardioidaceae bacterium]
MKVLVGIDKGTSAVKTVVLDADDGTVVGTSTRRTPTLDGGAGRHEEDMDTTWACVAETIAESLSSLEHGDEVVAVGVCGHMGGLWGLDSDGHPVGPAIGWPDSRAVDLLHEWDTQGLAERFFEIGGNALIAGMPSVLYAWMVRHEPARASRLRTVFLAKDYVNYRLTGQIATDESDLSFVPCDIRRRAPSTELFDLMGVPELAGLLPTAVTSETVVGRVTAEASRWTGLPEGTPVVAGLGDAVANALGVGAHRPGQAATVIGTSLMNVVTTDEAVLEPAGVGFTYLMPEGRWQRLLCNTGGGTLGLDWCLETLCGDDAARVRSGETTLKDLVEGPVAGVPPLAAGVTFLPFLSTAGSTAPFVDPWARGSFSGLSATTSGHHVLRAVLEGVAFSMRECYAAMPVDIHEIRMTGGGARSPLWRQICADVLGRELAVPQVEESGAVGAALAAGVGAGRFRDYADGIARLVRNGSTQHPDHSLRPTYDRGYADYQRLRESFTELWRARAAFLDSERRLA